MARAPNEKHLEFIEDTITRMSEKSFQTSAWCVTVVTAMFAFVINKDNTKEIIIASDILATALIVLFWGLDAFYLYLEKGYRHLYKIAAGILPNQQPDFIQNYAMEIPTSQRGMRNFLKAFFSKVARRFYLAMIAIFTLLTLYLFYTLGG